MKKSPIRQNLLLILCPCLLAGCVSNEELEKRLRKENEAYERYNERRKMRIEAREERDEMWFDRVMDID